MNTPTILDLETFKSHLESLGKPISFNVLPVYRIYRDLLIKSIKCEVIIGNDDFFFGYMIKTYVTSADSKTARLHIPINCDENIDLEWLRKISIRSFEDDSEICLCVHSPDTIMCGKAGHPIRCECFPYPVRHLIRMYKLRVN